MDSDLQTALAVVGMAGRFPGARSVDEFWENLCSGTESIRRYSDEELLEAGVDPALLEDPSYVKAGAPLDDMRIFDAGFFGLSPRDAAIMDPQHRHFLECAWTALEHAGHVPERFDGAIGVFAGSGTNAYLWSNLLTNPDLAQSVGFFLLRHTGNDKDFLSTRVSYEFDLRGPSVNVQTACSTSLVAVHMAGESLLSGECDLALAGGVTVEQPHGRGYRYEKGEILSPDGHCRPFDADAEGTVFGSGAGVVVLRRLEDALADGDTIHAVVRGSAVNNDGSEKVGYLAPSVEGQTRAVAEALAVSGVEADSIDYVEAHGTGTAVGDPIEVTALTEAFRLGTDRTGYCGLGSVKSNIGHLDTAAGVASLIKAVKALENGEIPPTLHFSEPNPEMNLEESPFYVADELTGWPVTEGPRRAGVSSLGVGGTNAHMILEEAPEVPESGPGREWKLFLLSARDRLALERVTSDLSRHVEDRTDRELADIAYTLQVGRRRFEHRRALVARDASEAVNLLLAPGDDRVTTVEESASGRRVAFLFAGGGAQHSGMGRALYDSEPLFREVVDRSLDLVQPHLDEDLRSLLYPEGPDAEEKTRLERPSVALPALFITQYAQAELWKSWGVEPEAMIGHSMGEYTAACLSGVLSLEDALRLVAVRGRLFEELPPGGMISVPLSEEDLRPLLGDELSIAAVNAPDLCVASGPVDAVDRLEEELAGRDVDARRIHIEVAAHSHMLESILDEFAAHVRMAEFHEPRIPFVSNLSGDWITAAEAQDPGYWVRQLRNTVRFAGGMGELLRSGDRVLLEVGPGRTLATLAGLHPDREEGEHPALASMPHPQEDISDLRFMTETLGGLWAHGADPDWKAFRGDEDRRRVPAPTYSFERQAHWVEPGEGATGPQVAETGEGDGRRELTDWFYEPSWRRERLLASDQERADPSDAPVLIFWDGSGLADALEDRLIGDGREVLTVDRAEPGAGFTRREDGGFALDPADSGAFNGLAAELASGGQVPGDILYLWPIDETPEGTLGGDEPSPGEIDAFYAPLYLAKALGREDMVEDQRLLFVSSNMLDVTGANGADPIRSLLLGPVQVLDREFSGVTARSVDLDLSDGAKGRSGQAAGQLLRELGSGSDDRVVAYRGPDRWVRSFESLPLPSADEETGGFGHEGVYLITGGLGGLGRTLAEWIAGEVPDVRLVLLSRTGLPPRDEWPVAGEEGDGRTGRKIRSVRSMEESGAEVVVLAADVTDPESIRSAVQETVSRFGSLDGVVHAAGVLDDDLVELKDPERARAVLAPKVQGTVNLWDALGSVDLDFLVLYSSVSAFAGLPGQVDYTAANAFLDAFARARAAEADTPYVVSVSWGPWREVGMAARLSADGPQGASSREDAAGDRSDAEGEASVVEVESPLLDRGARFADGHYVYHAVARPGRFWMLDEHQVREGPCIMPGSGFLALARAALQESIGPGPVKLRDVYFIAPFVLPDGGDGREIRVEVRPEGDAEGSVAIMGRPAGGSSHWEEHAQGRYSNPISDGGERRDVEELRRRCRDRTEEFQGTEYHRHLSLGPRWSALRRIEYGDQEAVATIELPEEHRDDLSDHPLHPSILDVATAGAQPLIEGFDRDEDFLVPVSYGSIVLHDELPASVFSHIRYRPEGGGDEVATFDVDILDADGSVVAEVEEFMMMRVQEGEGAFSGGDWSGSSTGELSSEPSEPADATSRAAHAGASAREEEPEDDGIDPGDGVEALLRILGHRPAPRVVVYPKDPATLMEERERESSMSGEEETDQDRAIEVDLSPVEQALDGHPSVAEAAAAAFSDRPDEIRVVAYVVHSREPRATVSELRKYLREQLPGELVPQNFVEMDALPRDESGELDRAALADPFGPVDDYVSPETPTEKTVAEIWSGLLGVDRVSLHDNFLDIGGHSLLAVRALRKMEAATGVELNPLVMTLNTLEQIAAQIDEERGEATEGGAPARSSGEPETEGDGGSSRGFLSAFRSVLSGS